MTGSRPGPALLCFNHQSWADPFVLMATLPWRPRLYFFGPKEEDMSTGGRNRIMKWTGTAIPFKPGKNDLIEATRKVGRDLRCGAASSRSPVRGGSTTGSGSCSRSTRARPFFALRSRRPAGAGRDQRDELAGLRAARSGSGSANRSRPAGRPTREAVDGAERASLDRPPRARRGLPGPDPARARAARGTASPRRSTSGPRAVGRQAAPAGSAGAAPAVRDAEPRARAGRRPAAGGR